MAGWREALEGLDEEHHLMLEGGSLSQLFLKYPLTICHPVFVGIVYGLLASLTLIVPFAYSGWLDSTDWQTVANDWGTISIIFCAMTASLGGFSTIISGMFVSRMSLILSILLYSVLSFLLLVLYLFWLRPVRLMPCFWYSLSRGWLNTADPKVDEKLL